MTATENTSAIVRLFQDVAGYFAKLPGGNPAETASVVFGMRERWKQINEGTNGANRVVFVPGSIPDGKDGVLKGAVGTGEGIDVDGTVKARALFDQEKIVTICIWAADPTDPGAVDETVQQQAIEQLFELVMQGIKRSAAGAANAAAAGAPQYNANPNERRFGIEYRLELAVDTRILDRLPGVAFPQHAGVGRKPGLV